MKDLEKDLRSICEAITLSPLERLFYSEDFYPVPGLIKSLLLSVPDAVVRPKNAQEVMELMKYACRRRIPVTVRGGGTSGLAAALPKKKGVVVDTTALNAVIEIDPRVRLVEVEVGSFFLRLDTVIRKYGLTLQSYPSSAHAATVGGWISTSGLGIGTLRFGPFSEQILWLEAVLPDGSYKRFEGQEARLFFGTEGTMGIITRAAFRLRVVPERTLYKVLSFPALRELAAFLRRLANLKTLPFCVEFFDPRYLSLLQMERQSHYEGDGYWSCLIALEGEETEVQKIDKEVEGLSFSCRATLGDGEAEWNERFRIMRIRRAVPGLLPMMVYIPLEGLERFCERLSGIRRPFALAGHLISNREVLLLVNFVVDEKSRWDRMFSLSNHARTVRRAIGIGGRPAGGIGLWNTPFLGFILDPQDLRDLRRKKEALDPKGVLNPGMWIHPSRLFRLYGPALAFLSLLERLFPPRNRPKTEGDVERCIQCGNCVDPCPTRSTWPSSTPRGRLFFSKRVASLDEDMKKEYATAIFNCTLCGRCKVDCSVSIESPNTFVDLRANLASKGLLIPSLSALCSTIGSTLNVVGKKNEDRLSWASRLEKPLSSDRQNGQCVYFVGCVASFYPMVQDIPRSFVRILQSCGVEFSLLGGKEWCCGYPLLSAGYKEDALRFMAHNMEALGRMGVKRLLVTCPGCYRMWKEHGGEGNGIEVLHATEFISQLIQAGRLRLGPLDAFVTYHDPCDLGRISGRFQEPRYIMQSIPHLSLLELEETKQYSRCCGSGGDLLVSNEKLSLELAKARLRAAISTGAHMLVTACPTCVRAFSMAKVQERQRIEVLDITQLVFKVMER